MGRTERGGSLMDTAGTLVADRPGSLTARRVDR